MEKEYRVIAKHRSWRNSFGEPEEERTQYLQEKKIRGFRLFGILSKHYWQTIDSEIVPSFAWIHKGVFGDESSWKSKFSKISNCKF